MRDSGSGQHEWLEACVWPGFTLVPPADAAWEEHMVGSGGGKGGIGEYTE